MSKPDCTFEITGVGELTAEDACRMRRAFHLRELDLEATEYHFALDKRITGFAPGFAAALIGESVKTFSDRVSVDGDRAWIAKAFHLDQKGDDVELVREFAEQTTQVLAANFCMAELTKRQDGRINCGDLMKAVRHALAIRPSVGGMHAC